MKKLIKPLIGITLLCVLLTGDSQLVRADDAHYGCYPTCDADVLINNHWPVSYGKATAGDVISVVHTDLNLVVKITIGNTTINHWDLTGDTSGPSKTLQFVLPDSISPGDYFIDMYHSSGDLVADGTIRVYSKLAQSCVADVWSCGDWNQCSASGTQTRSCVKTLDCPVSDLPSPATSQSCQSQLAVVGGGGGGGSGSVLLPTAVAPSTTPIVAQRTWSTIESLAFVDSRITANTYYLKIVHPDTGVIRFYKRLGNRWGRIGKVVYDRAPVNAKLLIDFSLPAKAQTAPLAATPVPVTIAMTALPTSDELSKIAQMCKYTPTTCANPTFYSSYLSDTSFRYLMDQLADHYLPIIDSQNSRQSELEQTSLYFKQKQLNMEQAQQTNLTNNLIQQQKYEQCMLDFLEKSMPGNMFSSGYSISPSMACSALRP